MMAKASVSLENDKKKCLKLIEEMEEKLCEYTKGHEIYITNE